MAFAAAAAKRQRAGTQGEASVHVALEASATANAIVQAAEGLQAPVVGATRIKSMSTGTVQRICSDQVIVDLPSALKELLENALDAGATRLDIRLKDNGVALLEVSDNGRGIPASDLEGIALRHHTSKLREFDDLERLSSFGFRGEALNSLAALSALSLTTRTAADVAGTSLTFARDGAIATRGPVARDVGTCVSVVELFEPFPVRRRELQRNGSAELRRLLALLQAYGVICDGVRFSCSHATVKGGKQTMLQTPGRGDRRAAISAIFGAKLLGELTPLSGADGAFAVDGYISRPRAGDGRRSGDRQFLFVNKRPVDFPRLSRLLNDAYRAATARSECFPVAFLNVTAPTDAYDINVTPDKRTVLFGEEAVLLALVKMLLEKLFSAETCTMQLQQPLLGFTAAAAANAGFTAAAAANAGFTAAAAADAGFTAATAADAGFTAATAADAADTDGAVPEAAAPDAGAQAGKWPHMPPAEGAAGAGRSAVADREKAASDGDIAPVMPPPSVELEGAATAEGAEEVAVVEVERATAAIEVEVLEAEVSEAEEEDVDAQVVTVVTAQPVTRLRAPIASSFHSAAAAQAWPHTSLSPSCPSAFAAAVGARDASSGPASSSAHGNASARTLADSRKRPRCVEASSAAAPTLRKARRIGSDGRRAARGVGVEAEDNDDEEAEEEEEDE